MPGERLSMRKIREVLRLRLGHGLSQRQVAQSLQLSVGAVNSYLSRARCSGLGWPLPDNLDDARLERLLFPAPPDVPLDQRPVPDWAAVHRELHRPNVTLALLWEEYRAGAKDGFGYSCYVTAELMLRGLERLSDVPERGVLLTQHNSVLRLADLHSIEVRHAQNQLLKSCRRSPP
jgi:Sigma-70, region 4